MYSEELIKCRTCPHECKINRIDGRDGRCKAGNKIKIALVSLHYYEEPCISGQNGSGTVFFSHCNMNCKFCQNYKISWEGKGKEISIEQLADTFLELKQKGANNINLVTPTIYAYQIIEAIKIAKQKGLDLPIIYNSNGYESIETLKKLEGYIDVYLPDLKYYDDEIAWEYSGVKDYFVHATKAIKEMYRQVGSPKLDKNGMIQKGLIIRHLVLPNYIENSKKVLQWIKENIDERVYVSIMAQYFPCYKAKRIPKLNRKLTQKEYDEIEEFVYQLDIQNGYMQDLGEHEEEYVPNFD